MQLSRQSGVLLHPTSLPGRFGIGTVGKEAIKFIDFLIMSGQRIWQTCPLGPTGYGDSPYQCFSAFAGNPLLIDIDDLIEKGLLNEVDCDRVSFSDSFVEFGKVIDWKFPLLRKAYKSFKMKNDSLEIMKFDRFTKNSEEWINDYALFMALKDNFAGVSWLDWPNDIRTRDEKALTKYTTELKSDSEFYKFIQYLFFSQWNIVKSYANSNGISIIGDMPLYVSLDSSDAWATPELFQFDEDYQPLKVSGVPPDYFSSTGQLWGNPLYNWDYMKKDGFSWWIRRIKANCEIANIVRFDHFRGLCAYWAVPYGDSTAINGSWVEAPGYELFEALKNALGDIPLIAEDLGVITRDVVLLRENFELPGMKILQFAFDSAEASSKDFIPHVYDKDCVVYTGTHDNDTVLGWYNKANDYDREYACSYLGVGEDISFAFIRGAWASTASLAIAAMQDILGLDSKSRMNTPGVPSGNWQWRFSSDMIKDDLVKSLRKITDLYGR